MLPLRGLFAPRDLSTITVADARTCVFATEFNRAALNARANGTNSFVLTDHQLPSSVDADYCDQHIPAGFEWSLDIQPACDTVPAMRELRVSWNVTRPH